MSGLRHAWRDSKPLARLGFAIALIEAVILAYLAWTHLHPWAAFKEVVCR